MVVKVKWFYHPEETKLGKRHRDGKVSLNIGDGFIGIVGCLPHMELPHESFHSFFVGSYT